MTDASGEVTFAARYTPWGDTLETYGTGNFQFGYFGGLMDEATGLIYVGNGQYYDPSTGRFLNRDAKPNNSNPYVPFDPMGMLFAPLGLMALVYGSKKKGSKWAILLVILSFAVVTGMMLSGCGSNTSGQFTATGVVTPVAGGVVATGTATLNGVTATGTVVVLTNTPASPTATIVPTCTLTTGYGIFLDTTPYGGNEIMQLFHLMQDYPDGWWHKGSIDFSFEVFVGLLVYHEAASANDEVALQLTAEAAAQSLYVGNADTPGGYCSYTQGLCNENAVANYWGRTSESAQGLVDDYVRLKKPIGGYYGYGYHGTGLNGAKDPISMVSEAKKLGGYVLHPATLNLDADNALSKYGNDTGWVAKIINDGRLKERTKYRDGNPKSVYYFLGDGKGVWYSKNQELCWKEGNNCHFTPQPDIINFGGG